MSQALERISEFGTLIVNPSVGSMLLTGGIISCNNDLLVLKLHSETVTTAVFTDAPSVILAQAVMYVAYQNKLVYAPCKIRAPMLIRAPIQVAS